MAELAGVSVRTLRHYHQVGVLPEPSRGSNGYRSYELAHVARLLRIRTLADLGVPLEQMPGLLDSPTAESSPDVLAELSNQLEQRIARLEAQRRRIDELRSTHARPDLSPTLVSFLESVGVPVASDLEEDASVLLARLFEAGGSADELQDLAAVLHQMVEHEHYADFAERFESLDPDASSADSAALADLFTTTFGPALSQVVDTVMGGRLRRLRAQDVPAVEVDPRLNDAQAEVLRRIGESL